MRRIFKKFEFKMDGIYLEESHPFPIRKGWIVRQNESHIVAFYYNITNIYIKINIIYFITDTMTNFSMVVFFFF